MDHGWKMTTIHHRAEAGETRIRLRPTGEAAWMEIRLQDDGTTDGAFDTFSCSPLVHARLIDLLDRMEPLVLDLEVKDETRFHEHRNPHALRRHFHKAHTLMRRVLEDAFRRGEDVRIGGKIHTQVACPARRVFQRAEDHVAAGRLRSALEALDLAVGLDPGFARAWVFKSEIQANLGKIEQALADANRAVSVKPGMAAGYLARAKARLHQDDLAGALRDLDTAVKVEPGLPEPRVWRGLVRHQVGDPMRALSDLQRVARPLVGSSTLSTDTFPGGMQRETAAAALTALALCHERLENFREERRTLEALRILDPGNDGEAIVPRPQRVDLDPDLGLGITVPLSWQVESGSDDPRIPVRLYAPGTGDTCRIALMKQWGEVSDPAFRKTFDGSVLKGLSDLGGSPEIVESLILRARPGKTYQVVVRLTPKSRTHCRIASFHRAGKMVTIYLNSKRSPEKTRAVLRRLLEAIESSKKGR